MTKGLPLFSFLDKRKLVEAPLTKGAMLNNKGKKQGTGTTTEARKEKFRKKGMERENKNMRLEDVNIDWAKAAADKTYGKPHLLTKQELHDYLWPKEAEEKRKEKETLEQDCKKLKKSSKAAKDGKRASSSANLDKREASPDTKDAQAKTEPVSLDKRDPKSDGAAKQAMEKVDPKQEIKQEAPKPNKSKVQTEVEKWEERTNLDKREVPKPFGPSPKEKAKEKQKESKPQTSSSSSSPASSSPDWDASDVSSSDHEPPAKKVKEEEGLTLKEAPEYLDKRYSWQPKRPRIAVDWHHTLEIRNNVSGANRRALQKLEDAGYDIFLCSYSGPDRQKETDFLSDGVYSNWCGKIFCHKPCGREGKAQALHRAGIKILFDDRWDVIQECGQWGIECFAIVPWWNAHGWGMNTYPSFDVAVWHFLDGK